MNGVAYFVGQAILPTLFILAAAARYRKTGKIDGWVGAGLIAGAFFFLRVFF